MKTKVQSVAKQTSHSFILEPGTWEGKGTIIVLQTAAVIHFTIRNQIHHESDEFIVMMQDIQLLETNELLVTRLEFSGFHDHDFKIEWLNERYGPLPGDGLITNDEISWKLLDAKGKIAGKAVFSKIDNNSYLINSAYQFEGSKEVCVSGIIKKI